MKHDFRRDIFMAQAGGHFHGRLQINTVLGVAHLPHVAAAKRRYIGCGNGRRTAGQTANGGCFRFDAVHYKIRIGGDHNVPDRVVNFSIIPDRDVFFGRGKHPARSPKAGTPEITGGQDQGSLRHVEEFHDVLRLIVGRVYRRVKAVVADKGQRRMVFMPVVVSGEPIGSETFPFFQRVRVCLNVYTVLLSNVSINSSSCFYSIYTEVILSFL